ncbi:MAG: DUF805 domain-containing protein [Elusimicrobia bacterium]|nr:DUF805 domain-containing protein [Elusimicrobiota bacterium]
MSWYLAVLKKYAVFSGRARRKEYWMYFLFNIIFAFVIGLVLGFAGAFLGAGAQLSDAGGLLYGLGMLVPSIAVGVRRMHDTGRSGWWLLVPAANLIFLLSDSQEGENEYGPNPKAAEPGVNPG